MSRAGRVWRHRIARRGLAVGRFPVRWWRAYLLDVARHPRASRCQVNPLNKFGEDTAGQRCHVLNSWDWPLHVHGTDHQWTQALAQRSTSMARQCADVSRETSVTTPVRRVAEEKSEVGR